MATLWLIQFWRPGGDFIAAWRKGGIPRRGLTILVTAALIGFATAWWQGFSALCAIALLVSGLGTVIVVVWNSEHGSRTGSTGR